MLALPSIAQAEGDLSATHLEAVDIIAASAMDAGFEAEMALTFGECFGVNMTDAEAAAFVAAEGVEAQQAITSSIAAHDIAVLCVASAMGIE